MVFSSVVFLFYFLPLALALYTAAPHRLKNAALLLISLFFYAWGEPVYVVLLLFSSVIDYINGLLLERYSSRQSMRRLVLICSIAVNIGVLCFFKYADFLILTINDLMHTNIAPLELPLPIGISFYTFQTMSYTIDVYRNRVQAQRNFVSFAAYVSMFPQLVAGPIVRYDDVDKQLNHRRVTMEQFAYGIKRFIIGLGKKLLLANNIGLLWDTMQNSLGMGELTTVGAWLGAVAFAFQIYFDFSGYSDMAIGLGAMLGFHFPENFRYPYISTSATEFWRRWHITLGSWFRDYVYFPMGGSRVGRGRLIFNLFTVWFLTGLWHGASWNFILWGLYFGLLIGLEKLWLTPVLERTWRPLRHLYLLLAALFGWVLFAIEDLQAIGDYIGTMLGFGQAGWFSDADRFQLLNYGTLLSILVVASTPWAADLVHQWKAREKRNQRILYTVIEILVLGSILVASTAYIIDDTYNPFLYFRF